MKQLLAVCLVFCSGLFYSYGQRSTEKTVKFKRVNYPIVPVTNVKSYKVVIHNGNIPVDLSALKEKKGLTSKLQGFQDDINNKTPDYYSYTTFMLDPNQPDVTIEFSFGTFQQIGVETREHNIPCVMKGQKISKETVKECPAYYYEFKYALPYVIRITDKTGSLILNQHNEGNGVHTFGYDGSGLSGFLKKLELETAYQNQIKNNKLFIAEKAIVSKLEESEAIIQEAFYFSRFTEKIDVASATGKGFDYTALDQAQAFAVSGFEKLSQGNTEGARADFDKALPVWKKEVTAVDMGNENARINRKIATNIYLNIINAYYHLWEADSAGAYLAEANRVGRFTNKSEELVVFSSLISKRKESLNVYKTNTNAKGSQVQAENLLEKIRVKQSKALYNPVTNESKYQVYTQSLQKKEESSQAKMFEEMLGGLGAIRGLDTTKNKSNTFEERVQRTGFQGYLLILTAFVDGKMDTLPQQICDITYLNELNISNNSLKFIPSDIGKLKDLKRLHLVNNQLTSLPAEMASLQNLKVLNIKGNNIPKDEIDKIQKLLPTCKIKS